MTANATSMLTRRVKQGVAEWYVRDLIEKSRPGMAESVRQGWHTGGGVLRLHAPASPHPNPNKAREGMQKHRLVLAPIRAAVVLMIFEDYCVRHLGMGTICDKLNRDLERYPPPARKPKDENGLPPTWSKSQIQGMLRNPKYTGYNVCNRHDKRKGRPLIRPSAEWIWSPTPSHEAIVTKELFDIVTERDKRNEIGPRQRAPRPTSSATRIAKGASTPCVAACAASCADAVWKAATRGATTVIAAASSTAEAPSPPTPPDTHARSGSRRRPSSPSCRTS